MPKYNNFAELSEAFKKGEIEEGYHMYLDKGGSVCSLSFFNEELSDEENEQKNEECQELFCPENPEEKEPIELLLEALGIPCQWS